MIFYYFRAWLYLYRKYTSFSFIYIMLQLWRNQRQASKVTSRNHYLRFYTTYEVHTFPKKLRYSMESCVIFVVIAREVHGAHERSNGAHRKREVALIHASLNFGAVPRGSNGSEGSNVGEAHGSRRETRNRCCMHFKENEINPVILIVPIRETATLKHVNLYIYFPRGKCRNM